MCVKCLVEYRALCESAQVKLSQVSNSRIKVGESFALYSNNIRNCYYNMALEEYVF